MSVFATALPRLAHHPDVPTGKPRPAPYPLKNSCAVFYSIYCLRGSSRCVIMAFSIPDHEPSWNLYANSLMDCSQAKPLLMVNPNPLIYSQIISFALLVDRSCKKRKSFLLMCTNLPNTLRPDSFPDRPRCIVGFSLHLVDAPLASLSPIFSAQYLSFMLMLACVRRGLLLQSF